MDDSMAQAREGFRALIGPAAWKSFAGGAAAVVLGLAFIVAGVWKITDPFGAATRMTQALVWPAVSLPLAIGMGVAETAAGVFLFIPRLRRWGAWATGGLLVVFMLYFAVNYPALRGVDCTCFPWLKRAVGPEFFIGDAIMLAAAVLAGWWSRPSEGLRNAALITGAAVVFAGVSFGVLAARQTGAPAPETVTVDGRPYSLAQGRILIYFFDPECSHCDEAARRMAKLDWSDTKLVSVATRVPQFASAFLKDTGFRSALTPDLKALQDAFPFVAAPYAVAVEHGRQVASLAQFDEREPAETLRRLGFAR